MSPEVESWLLPDAKARRTIFVGFRAAASSMWGPAGLELIGSLMSPSARKETVDPVTIAADMLPEAYVLEWYQAVWEGPAERNKDLYNEFLGRMMDHGFGRVRKFFLQMARPTVIASKCAELWRHDHTTGELEWISGTDDSAVLTLSDHAYVTTPLARASIVEILRYAVTLGRVVNVRATYVQADTNTIRMTISWD